MNQVNQLLKKLSNVGVNIKLSDVNDIKVRGNKSNLTPELIGELKANKAALIALLKEHESHGESAAFPIGITGATEAPLSFSQHRLWFIEQFERKSSQYNMPYALRFSGWVDETALQHALTELIRRHQGLRTTFHEKDGVPYQVVRPAGEFSLRVLDLTGQGLAADSDRVRQIIGKEANTRFDLSADTMLRVKWIKLDTTESVLLITTHHIVFDGWSLAIVIRELSFYYNHFCRHNQALLPELTHQYVDYAIWQQDIFRQGILGRQLDFWRATLNGAPQVHNLPLDGQRPAEQAFAGNRLGVSLAKTLCDDLKRLAAQRRTTLFVVLQAIFTLLLSRWSNENDILIGTPVAGRTHTELEGIVGFFVNTLVLRNQLREDMTFAELLRACNDNTQRAFANQWVPFDLLVRELKPERSLSHAPLVQILLSLRNNEVAELELDGLKTFDLDNQFAPLKFDLELFATENADGMELLWNYSSDLFAASTIERMANCFNYLARQVVADAELPLAELSMVDAGHRRELIALGAGAEVNSRFSVDQLFEHWAGVQPEAIALTCNGQQYSYGTLNRRANQLANYLVAGGVRQEEVVAICARRSVELFTAMLAVLKAGGAYVVLDPEYPVDRLRYMLEDSGSRLVLLDSRGAGLPGLEQAVAVRLDNPQIYAQCDRANLDRSGPGQLACIIYTSGSTGRPKGVMIEHKGIVRLVHPASFMHYAPDDVVAQTSNCAFDAVMLELWGAWCNGARLCHVDRDTLLDSARLGEFISREKISILFVTSALLGQLSLLDSGCLASLKVLCFGGEQADLNAVNRIVATGKPGHLINAYGPSENSCVSTFHEISEVTDWKVPIGRPIDGSYHYVLDTRGNMVPVGVIGELCVGGPGLARAYLNKARITQEKFVADTFREGQRMYRSGDLVRYRADGTLEFVGRTDDQVKIRGFRIELKEIENALAGLPGVDSALVLVQEEEAGRFLVAYVTLENSDRPLPEVAAHLKAQLKKMLPEYMVPSAFIPLASLPLNANGKVDKSALPKVQLQEQCEYIEPKNKTEQTLADIWKRLLKVEKISAEANFFESGGHSLLATRLASAISAELEFAISVRELFEHSVLSDLAAHIDNNCAEVAAEALTRVPRASPLPLSFAQTRLFFIEQLEGKITQGQYNLTLAFRVRGNLQLERIEKAVNHIVQRHEVLRSSYDYDGDRLHVRVHENVVVRLIRRDCRGLTETQIRNTLKQFASVGFDLHSAPMLRPHALVLNEHDHILLFCFHHIASDGWSVGIFARELETLYRQSGSEKTPSLPELAVQYADFACWQRQLFEGETLSRQLEYWHRQLANLPARHSLPLDKPRPSRLSFAGDTCRTPVPAALAAGLKRLASEQGVTLFMLYQAVFAVLLSRWSYSDDIVMGTTIAGRRHRQIETLIGFFVNTLVLRTDLSAAPTLAQLLQHTKNMTLDAFDNQDVPFEMLVERLSPERQINCAPLFQILFSMQNNEPVQMGIEGLDIALIEAGNGTVKFDLALHIIEIGNQTHAVWEYNLELFERATIQRFAEHYLALLQESCRRPDTPVTELPMITEADRRRLLTEFRSTQRFGLPALCVHQLFEARVEQHPEKVALECGQRRISYARLNARANQLARYLLDNEVRPGATVGICSNRNINMVVAVLGIVKAGAAYVPLDPDYPNERLLHIIESSELTMVLSESNVRTRLSEKTKTVLLDAPALFERYSTSNVEPGGLGVDTNSLAYVLFTSGSTGKPKGVEITHRNILSLLSWAEREFVEGELNRILFSTSMNFDPSVFEIFATLCLGNTGVIVENALSLLERKVDFSFIGSVPSALRVLIENNAIPETVRIIAPGGEPLTKELVNDALAKTACRSVYNLYGPTECTVDATFERYDAPIYSMPTIGRPLANVEVHVLSKQGQLLPIGAVGELYIGGACVGPGYHRREELTRERFKPNPFAGGSERLYRTGDLVRFLPDGRLRFLGRCDDQVKVRGFRIELAEIALLLEEDKRLAEVAVQTRQYGNDRRIVAYLRAGQAYSPAQLAELKEELRHSLASALPEYMVPARFVWLNEFPKLPNGKIDKEALPEPAGLGEEVVEPPATETEAALLDVWAQVLGVDRENIGRKSNFFQLGGHSLLLVQLLRKIDRAMGVSLPVAVVYQQPTIDKLASHIDKTAGFVARDDTLVVIQEGRREREPLFVIHPIGGDVYCYGPLIGMLGLDCPVLGLQRAEFTTRADIVNCSVESLANAYLEKILGVQKRGPYKILGWSLGGLLAVRIGHLLESRGHEVEYLGLIDSVAHRLEASTVQQLHFNLDKNVPVREFRQKLEKSPESKKHLDRFLATWKEMVNELIAIYPGVPEIYVQDILLANFLAGINFSLTFQVRRIHYYGAQATLDAVPATLIDSILACSRVPPAFSVLPGNHHSIMRNPGVGHLAKRIKQDLAPIETVMEQSL